MGNQIIITKWEGKTVSFTMNEGRMIGAGVEPFPDKRLLGNIYVGKVKNIVENIGAAFVEIENGILCYMSLADKGEPIFVNSKNNMVIKAGDELIVQVTRENVKTKQPVASYQLNLTGKYLVLVKDKNQVFFSSKISKKETKEKWYGFMKGYLEEGFGFIVRTNALHASDQLIVEEGKRLIRDYEALCKEGIHRTCFSCLYRAPSSYVCEIRDAYQQELDQIITDEKDVFLEIKEYLERYQKEDLPKLHFYQEERVSLNTLYSLRSQFEKAFVKKVWLKSGGNILIEHTEACTVIDVNTEKAIRGKKKNREIYRKVNLEAAKEIAYQLRLRNLSGIILVDFIDMESKEYRQELMDYLNEMVKTDPVKTDVVDMTKLGLVEMTRKKIRKPLYEQWRA